MASERVGDDTPPLGIALVQITSAADIVTARQHGRELAAQIGFAGSDLTVIATAISELARNILDYANTGTITVVQTKKGSRIGIQILARDEGPGIPDIPQALQDGYSTGRGLGLGLPGVRRLMDDFEIVSVVGQGTTVKARKWIT